MQRRLLLAVDGTNLLYRSFHALRKANLSYAGRPIGAVHGFLSQLARFVTSVSPSQLLIAFDTVDGAPSRRSIDPGYKAHRSTPPDELVSQLQWAPMVLNQIGLGSVSAAGWEADDLLASAAVQGSCAGLQVVLLTADRDAWQLVDDQVSVLSPEGSTTDRAALFEKFGVTPQGYALLAALRGEPSDGLAGVAGVGAVTAARLAARFETFDALRAASDADLRAVLSERLVGVLRASFDRVEKNQAVGMLRDDLPVRLDDRLDLLDADFLARRAAELGLQAAGLRLADALRGLPHQTGSTGG